jgi:flagellar biosynthesis chaperone FliJ
MAIKVRTLKRILKLRKYEEQVELLKFSKAQALAEEENQTLKHLTTTRSEGFRGFDLSGEAHGLALVAFEFVGLREQQIHTQSKRLESAKAAAEKQFQVLQEKIQQRKMIEKLIDKEKLAAKKEARKKQQKAQDEFSSS